MGASSSGLLGCESSHSTTFSSQVVFGLRFILNMLDLREPRTLTRLPVHRTFDQVGVVYLLLQHANKPKKLVPN